MIFLPPAAGAKLIHCSNHIYKRYFLTVIFFVSYWFLLFIVMPDVSEEFSLVRNIGSCAVKNFCIVVGVSPSVAISNVLC